MGNGEDWLLRPILRGLCGYESLVNGALNIVDIARMNDAINVFDFNNSQYKETA